ncbi:hypothetical protein Hanom_Chr06g00510221 [Helianthus anomalus]
MNIIDLTLAGHAGKPLTLARTRSPKFNLLFALAPFAPPRFRVGAIGHRLRYQNPKKRIRKGNTRDGCRMSDRKPNESIRIGNPR